MEKENNNKCLYTCETIVDSYEYKKMAKHFPYRIYWDYVKRGTFINLMVVAVIAIITRNFATTTVCFAIWQIWLMIDYKVRLEYFAEKGFNSSKQKENFDTTFETEFYDDYFIRKGETISFTIKYSDISKCVETDTNFYLECPVKKIIIIFQKDKCSHELMDFIRMTFGNIENKKDNTSNLKREKRYHNPNFIKTGMLVLFIITIASLWGALYTKSWIDQLIPQYGFSTSKNMWVFWCLLPIPILSIILGFKYKKAGFKCTKNIVGGFIIGFFLLVYGSFCMFPTHEQEYSKINDYKEIINLELPDSGVLEVIDWDSYQNKDMTEYTTINAYYAQVDVTELVKSIENNPNWILSQEMKTEHKVFLTSLLVPDDDAYFSIYNKTTNEYNVLPEKSGAYEIYAMKYDKSDNKLQIDKFKISYNK